MVRSSRGKCFLWPAALTICLAVGHAVLAAGQPGDGDLLHLPHVEDASEESGPSAHDRIDQLTGQYKDLSEKYSQLSGDYKELSKSLKGYSATGHDASTMKVSGRVHFDVWGFPSDSPGVNAFETLPDPGDPIHSPQDSVGFRRLRFGVNGTLWHNMLYKIEAEFAGGNRSEFRDAYLGWKEVPFLQKVQLGNQKRPYGLDHLNSSRFNVFLERPFVIESFNQDARRLGLQSQGVSEAQVWNWRYGVFNQRLIQDEGNYISDHWQMEVAGRLANTFWYDESSGGRGYAHWAISGSAADPDGSNLPGRATNEARYRTRPEARSVNRWLDTGLIDGADNANLLGLENVWNFGPLQLVGEYQNLWVDRVGGSDLHFHGGYFYAAYFLTGEHMPWKRSSGTLDRIKPIENFFLVDTCCDGIRGGWGAWQVAYRWSFADLSDDDILGGVGESHTLGLNWYWNAYARMQLNAIYGEIDEHEPVAGFTFGHYTIVGARFMVNF